MSEAKPWPLTGLVGYAQGQRLGQFTRDDVERLCRALGCLSVQGIENSLRGGLGNSGGYMMDMGEARDLAEKVMLELYPKLQEWCKGSA